MRTVATTLAMATLGVLLASGASAETLSVAADSTIDLALPEANFGDAPTLMVQGAKGPDSDAGRWSFLRFDLSSLPEGTSIHKATLRLPVAAVAVPGTLELHLVLEDWEEASLTAAGAPVYSPVSALEVTAADAGHSLIFDISDELQDWVSDHEISPNHGILLLPGPDGLEIELGSRDGTAPQPVIEIQRLPPATGTPGILPAGAVVPFNRPACPDGWREYGRDGVAPVRPSWAQALLFCEKR